MSKRRICVDFDGVLHSYISGWKGVAVIPDPPVPGALEWLIQASARYELYIYSSRSSDPDGRAAMIQWCERHFTPKLTGKLHFPTNKPAASLYIDDRGWRFDGTFPSPNQIDQLRTWQGNK